MCTVMAVMSAGTVKVCRFPVYVNEVVVTAPVCTVKSGVEEFWIIVCKLVAEGPKETGNTNGKPIPFVPDTNPL